MSNIEYLVTDADSAHLSGPRLVYSLMALAALIHLLLGAINDLFLFLKKVILDII